MKSEEEFMQFRQLNGEKLAGLVKASLESKESISIVAPLGSGKTYQLAEQAMSAVGASLYLAPTHAAIWEFVNVAKKKLKNHKKLIALEGHTRGCGNHTHKCYKQSISDAEIKQVLELDFIDKREIRKILPNTCPHQLIKKIINECCLENLIIAAPYIYVHIISIDVFKTVFIDEADQFARQILLNDLVASFKIAADVSSGVTTKHATKETSFSTILRQKSDNLRLQFAIKDTHFIQENNIERLIQVLKDGQDEYCSLSGSTANGSVEVLEEITTFLKSEKTKYLADLIDIYAEKLENEKEDTSNRNLITDWMGTPKKRKIRTNHKIAIQIKLPLEDTVDLKLFMGKQLPFAVKYYAVFVAMIEKCNGTAYLCAFTPNQYTHHSEVALVAFQKEKFDAFREIFKQRVCILVSATSNGLEKSLFENIHSVTICEGRLPYTAKYLVVPYVNFGKVNRKIKDLPARILAGLNIPDMFDESLVVVYENSKSDARRTHKMLLNKIHYENSVVAIMETNGDFRFPEQKALDPIKPPHRVLVSYIRDRSYRGTNASDINLLIIAGTGIPSINAVFLVYGILKSEGLITDDFEEFIAKQRKADIVQVANRSHRDGTKNRIVVVNTDLKISDFPSYVSARMKSLDDVIPKNIKKTKGVKVTAIINYIRAELVQNIPRTQIENIFKNAIPNDK